MVHLLPMSDRNVEIVRHLVSDEEYKRMETCANTIKFIKKYQNIVKKVKQFEKCPYKNHTGDKK
jgi:hypothetical protein